MMRMRTMVMAALAVAGCSSGGGSGSPTKQVSIPMAMATLDIATDGDQHVSYLANPTINTTNGSTGELHVADASGKDTKLATGIFVGSALLSPRGKGMVYEQMNAANTDAALYWVDLTNPSAAPKQLFASGLISPAATPPIIPTPLSQLGFLTPSGRYYVVGVLPPMVNQSADLHVIDMDTGTDVFQRTNGGFAYLEVALPDDTLVFQDAVGNNTGPSAPPGVQTLFWVSLASPGNPTTIDTRTGQLTPSGDNKTLVYQNADQRELFSWDTVGKPAAGTKIASNALNFAVGDSGPVAYIGTDHSVHVVDLTGKESLAVAGTVAKADLFSPVYISGDGADVYYFQNVDTENSRGVLMHVSATAGATPNKLADAGSLNDVHPIPGGLLFLQNVDGTGSTGDAVKSARDGSGAMMLGTAVPVGFLTFVTPSPAMTPVSKWVSPHLAMSMENKNQKLADGIRAIVGQLEVTTPTASTVVDPSVRLGQFTASPDLSLLAYVGGVAYDSVSDNYVGNLGKLDLTANMKSAMPVLTGVSELGVLTMNKKIFVNAPKAMPPGVYLIDYSLVK